jgi:hypothetical protein
VNYAPIALFVYKRPDHTRQTIEHLMRCPEFKASQLYVFCDGAKRPEDQDLVAETRSLVRSLVGDQAKLIEAPANRGLANSIIAGVTQLVNEYDRVIVLEDDLLVSPQFLTYMNAALDAYQDQPSVMQVSGYMFPVPEFRDRAEAMVLPFIVSWGWATWKRAWQRFDAEATGWEVLQTDLSLRSRFNLDDSYDYFTMLNQQMQGQVDSWAIRWYWSVFSRGGCALFPPASYVNNIGFDGSGSHGWLVARWLFKSSPKTVQVVEMPQLPAQLEVQAQDYTAVKKSIQGSNAGWLTALKKVKNSVVKLARYAAK